ncbi:MAG: glycosyltransferase, partial [Firmicutes bacterium]|nr:glycosyltransferase [Bacillota bacterium]
VVSLLKQNHKISSLNYVVMTDYSVHSQWIHPEVDAYFVGSIEMQEELLRRGIAEERIIVSGIPVDVRFRETVDHAAIRKNLGIGQEPVVLFMGGAYMPYDEYMRILKAIDHAQGSYTIIVVAGREKLRQQMAQIYQKQAYHRMIVLNYVTNVHELMAISALLISKAGGLTTTEALCRGLPIIIFRPIPGQEEANANFLVRNGAGLHAYSEKELTETVESLFLHPESLQKLVDNAVKLGHPTAALTVAECVYNALDRKASNVQS